MSHYVYSLHDASGALLYVGRSKNPRLRCSRFRQRHGIEVHLGPLKRYANFEAAAQAELVDIRRFDPPYNEQIGSTHGRLGKVNTAEHRAKIGAALRGIKRSEEANRRNADARRGKPLSEATKRKMSEARRRYLHGI